MAIERWELPERANNPELNLLSSNALGNLRYGACGSQVNSGLKCGFNLTNMSISLEKHGEYRRENMSCCNWRDVY